MEDVAGSRPIERIPDATLGAKPRRSGARVFKIGCLSILLTMCASLGLLGWALQSGPVSLKLLEGNTLKVGSDDFVLSNYSFQNGTTYYIDLNGNDVRNILQLHYLEDTHRLELVMHYASRSEQGEHHLAEFALP